MSIPVEEIKAAFSLFDINGDGKLAQVMRSLGLNPSDEELNNMLAGQVKQELNFDDFVALMTHAGRDPDMSKEIDEAFLMFDREGNGLLGAGGDVCTPEEVESAIDHLCQSGIGQISLEEFKQLV